MEKLKAFTKKLNLFHADLISGRLLHFETLKTVGECDVTENMVKFIVQLRDNFVERFEDFSISKDVIGFVRDPFSFNPGGEFSTNVRKVIPLDEACVQRELIDIQSADNLKAALHGSENASAFWVACPNDYKTLRTLAMYVLTMFGSTYT